MAPATPSVSRAREAVTRRVVGLPRWGRWALSPYPPGHYHSPLPDADAIERETDRASTWPETLPGIDLARAQQLALLEEFAGYRAEMPFGRAPTRGLRYRLDCTWFAFGDGVALYSQLRHLRPRRYLEIGSGFSSACALDTSERFLDGSVEFTFIEPNAQRLRSVLSPEDQVRIIEEPLRPWHADLFADVEAGDVLFIDSSHVTRAGSEVNQLFLDVLPSLPAGVHVHVHDIFWPFSYPARWLRRGRAWNEAYLLRALLCHNPRLGITWFNSYLGATARDQVGTALPEWAEDPGSSIWLSTR